MTKRKAKTAAERQAELRARRKAQGLTEVKGIFAPNDAELRKKIRREADLLIQLHNLEKSSGK